MTIVALVPVVLSLLVLGAHFLRADNVVLLVVPVLLLGLLVVRRPWSARIVQVGLVLGALEWLRTIAVLAGERLRAGEPALRLIAILGTVAAVTALSALLFQVRPLRRTYRLGKPAAARRISETHHGVSSF